jgi:hypothetical protein
MDLPHLHQNTYMSGHMTCTQCLDNWRSRLQRISSNCPLSTCTANLQRSEDFLPMYPISFSRAEQPWAKRRWAGVYCTSDKFSTCVCMINMPRYFPICTYKISPRSVLWQVYSTLRKGVVCVSTPCSGFLTGNSPSRRLHNKSPRPNHFSFYPTDISPP